MSQATMNRKVSDLMQELHNHPHSNEIIKLMYEQLEDDM
jgi:hypothetical protein